MLQSGHIVGKFQALELLWCQSKITKSSHTYYGVAVCTLHLVDKIFHCFFFDAIIWAVYKEKYIQYLDVFFSFTVAFFPKNSSTGQKMSKTIIRLLADV